MGYSGMLPYHMPYFNPSFNPLMMQQLQYQYGAFPGFGQSPAMMSSAALEQQQQQQFQQAQQQVMTPALASAHSAVKQVHSTSPTDWSAGQDNDASPGCPCLLVQSSFQQGPAHASSA